MRNTNAKLRFNLLIPLFSNHNIQKKVAEKSEIKKKSCHWGWTFGEEQIKELLKETNVPLGSFEAHYDIENTLT